MAVYNEIIAWSNNKANFIKDALRRLIQSPTLSQVDIDDLILLLKKDVGFLGITNMAIPINSSHLPSSFLHNTDVASLVSIENPININALYNRTKLEFAKIGLTVVYGNNGSGKSSYSKILKKVCWSRHKDFQLKSNVYTNDITPQGVTVNYEFINAPYSYLWNNNQRPNAHLNSIFVFDNDCAELYLNSEKITEYKPLGIDLLERLLDVFSVIEQKIIAEKQTLVTQKPLLNIRFNSSKIYNWYQGIERLDTIEIQSTIQFTQANIDRKRDLIILLNSVNPVQQKMQLEQKKVRFQSLLTDIQHNLRIFTSTARASIIGIKLDYNVKCDAYILAQQSLAGTFPLNGVGSESWRLLWEAAKEFAVKEVHPDNNSFPSETSEQYCVFCQQQIQDEAKDRLQKFNLFINDKTSSEFEVAKQKLLQLKTGIEKLNLAIIETIDELDSDIENFKMAYNGLINEFEYAKKEIIEYLEPNNRDELGSLSKTFDVTTSIQNEINRIEQSVLGFTTLINGRGALEMELSELEALEILDNNRTHILAYHREYLIKVHLDKCLSNVTTTMISKKIGDLLGSEAIALQQQEFLTHLSRLNNEIASKISIKKTKTSNGKTYQRCGFNLITENVSQILSEGEQKIVALANFLSECTIDNRTNSIIFDDPVTSLDQDYREAIAKILVELSANRQLIVLTHDLSFLRLIIDTHKNITATDCHVVGIEKYNGMTGIVSDEIPYLVKNVDERISSIRRILAEHDSLHLTDGHGRETKLDSARKRFRMLLERSVEEILSNKTYERFSKIIQLKKGNLSSYIITQQSDIDLLLGLFAKYSVTEHDGGTSTIPQLPTNTVIQQDIRDYMTWKNDFKARLKAFLLTYN